MKPNRPDEVVILLHGIINKRFFLFRIENALKAAGYRVINWGYRSVSLTIDENIEALHAVAGPLKEKKIHFVGFSLGAILIRCYLKRFNPPNAGRVVMIAPPNRGTAMVDRFHPRFWFRWIFGSKAIRQMGTAEAACLDKECGAPPCEFGVIAGGRGDGKGFNPFLNGDNDGTILVESARLDGAKDFILLPYTHTMLIFVKKTALNVVQFIRDGSFIHEK